MRSYDLFIDGRATAGSGWTYVIRAAAFLDDPATAFDLKRGLELGLRSPEEAGKDLVGRCALSSDEQVAAALRAAARAKPLMAAVPLEVRRQVGDDFHRSVGEHAEEFVDLLVAEGHPRRLAEWETSGVLRGTGPETLDWQFGQLRQEEERDGRLLVLARKPDGVVCVNPPQNAAGSNSGLGIMALLGGNSLVVKAPRATPMSVMFLYQEILAPILDRHGLPGGAINLVSGDSRRILRQWLNSELTDDLMFFGDSATGLKLGQDWVAKGKKAILELSGNDGVVVWHDADLDAAADALSECFHGSSQICMVPKYAVAHPAIAEELIERVVDRARSIRPGYPDDPEVLLSPVLKQDLFFDFLAEARQGGAEVRCGGRRLDVHGRPADGGLFLEPAVLRVQGLARARELRCVAEETFFPMLPIVVPEAGADHDLLDDVIAFVDTNRYGLRNSLWTGDDAVTTAFTERVGNGGLLRVNDSHIAFAPVLATHGGTGRTGGPYGELHYPILRTTHLQGISIRNSPR
ncbi:aldehyde dehydrogenase family protein [Amycolatopsis alba]|uniref:Aldehyde dehydrogenase n=1 Tax=Amycolatopsis alba DSM 44262 TaxID=1125972 RepID=A0A229RF22_AMYAL|nr:aldehyde dehydrogenase [Amycolatopsis alba]OXM45185.1 aldehyde dehydrogenase [Amycolatopsis alba DSM 44262]